VRQGRERAGKELDGFDIVAAVPSAVTNDADAARERLRGELVPYFNLPFYRTMLERSGWDADVRGFDERGIEAISDAYLDSLAAIGPAEDAVASVRRYHEAGATSPAIGGVSKTDFDATLEALANCV
jgi:alkanesulfonate monooxygenase SsuD/methylene tetrahydromethanopterin reductase-like flavin-dependent oxidoreductase (luciferase family)